MASRKRKRPTPAEGQKKAAPQEKAKKVSAVTEKADAAAKKNEEKKKSNEAKRAETIAVEAETTNSEIENEPKKKVAKRVAKSNEAENMKASAKRPRVVSVTKSRAFQEASKRRMRWKKESEDQRRARLRLMFKSKKRRLLKNRSKTEDRRENDEQPVDASSSTTVTTTTTATTKELDDVESPPPTTTTYRKRQQRRSAPLPRLPLATKATMLARVRRGEASASIIADELQQLPRPSDGAATPACELVAREVEATLQLWVAERCLGGEPLTYDLVEGAAVRLSGAARARHGLADGPELDMFDHPDWFSRLGIIVPIEATNIENDDDENMDIDETTSAEELLELSTIKEEPEEIEVLCDHNDDEDFASVKEEPAEEEDDGPYLVIDPSAQDEPVFVHDERRDGALSPGDLLSLIGRYAREPTLWNSGAAEFERVELAWKRVARDSGFGVLECKLAVQWALNGLVERRNSGGVDTEEPFWPCFEALSFLLVEPSIVKTEPGVEIKKEIDEEDETEMCEENEEIDEEKKEIKNEEELITIDGVLDL